MRTLRAEAKKPGLGTTARRLVDTVGHHPFAVGIATVIIVGAISMALSMQGWRGRTPAFDLLPYHVAVHELLESGVIPRHGDTGSYGSYKPPGTAWLMLPGIGVLGDPRLAEYIGTGLLHFGALAALYLLGRRYFGQSTAIAAVVLYGLSSHGLFLAGSLWPNGRPDFFLLAALLGSLWIDRRDGRFLAATVGVLAVGMYVDMALAPALLVLPVLWALYRPPVALMPLAVTAAVVAVVWSPYLQFEASRGFADIRSQLLLQNIAPLETRAAWCDPDRPLLTLVDADVALPPAEGAGPRAAVPPPLGRLFNLAATLSEKALYNFTGAVTGGPLPGLLLAVLAGAALCLYSVTGAQRAPGSAGSWWRSRWTMAALGLAVAGALVHELARSSGISGANAPTPPGTVQRLGLALAVTGAGLLVARGVVHATDATLMRLGITLQSRAGAARRRVLVLWLVVPWTALAIAAEPGKPERFWWIWPLQVLFLAALACHLLPRLGRPRAGYAVLLVIAAAILVNPTALGRLDGWSRAGWAGEDAPEVRVVDAIADHATTPGRAPLSIGYETFVYEFMAAYHVTNPVYKVGAEFDLLLRSRHGIVNTNGCAEGLSDQDVIRVVQTRRKVEAWQPRDYFEEHRSPTFRLEESLGLYEVWVRQ